MLRLDHAHRVAKMIKSCREDSGYESARAFYDCAGGHAVLRCNYATYRRLEETGRLPKPATFARIYEGLENACDPRQLQELARAYAQALLGEDMAAWPPQGRGIRNASRSAALTEAPPGLCDDIWSDPLKLAAVVALEAGRTSVGDLPGPPAQARRALNSLVRTGLARRHGDTYIAQSAFPIVKVWTPTVRERDDLVNRIFSISDEADETVGGATVFVHSDRGDMEEFFHHMRAAIAPHLREARKESARGGPVYMLEFTVRERIRAHGDE